MILTTETEKVIALGVGLEQNGKMKSSIHIKDNTVIIMNMDDTIITRNLIKQNFKGEVSFFANDYESPNVEIQGGKIVFKQTKGGFQREKVCSKPKNDFIDVLGILATKEPIKEFKVSLDQNVCSLLEDGLSHVEFHNDNGELRIVQKDIYTGASVQIKSIQKGLINQKTNLPDGMIVGLRTSDFKALFYFNPTLDFYFQSEDSNYVYFSNEAAGFDGIVSVCIYDELNYIQKGSD